jgi:hypothetical protein
MLAMHLTGGQLARAPEIGSIKVKNSATTMRNVFIHCGDLFFVTDYHKARSITNLSHVVARFLPEPVARLVVIFIAFIRPFMNMIYNKISACQNTTDGDYLFCDELQLDQCWDGKQLTQALQQASHRYLGASLGVQSYRHFAVAVTRKYIKEVTSFFTGGDGEQERGKDAYAWQTGHMEATNTAHYGLDVLYPSQLQLELLDKYRRISRHWHEWLGFSKKEAIVVKGVGGDVLVNPNKKRNRVEEGDHEITDPQESPGSQKLRRKVGTLELGPNISSYT